MEVSTGSPAFPKASDVSVCLWLCVGVHKWIKASTQTLKEGTEHSPALAFRWAFHCLSCSVAMRGAEGITPSWTASASTKAPTQILWRRHESFHQLQATLDPAQASQPNDSSERFFPQKHREKMKLSQLAGVHADEFPPLYFVNKQRAVAILLIPVFVHHSWDKSKGVLNPILLLESF